jgi:hypothetical protein
MPQGKYIVRHKVDEPYQVSSILTYLTKKIKMKKAFKPDIKILWDKISTPNILNDVIVQNEFSARKLKLKDIADVTLVFRYTGTVYVFGHFSTESHTCEIAIMKMLIKDDIVSNENNYE